MSVFRRRRKRSIPFRALEIVWPRMGWRRAGRYFVFRIKRLPGTPYTIACGFALGAAVSFTPFIGLHFVIAGIIAWALRANILFISIGPLVLPLSIRYERRRRKQAVSPLICSIDEAAPFRGIAARQQERVPRIAERTLTLADQPGDGDTCRITAGVTRHFF